MADVLTARDVGARIQARLGVPWNAGAGDGVQYGNPAAAITGIVSAWTPSMEVLQKAVQAKANLVVTRECPFWSREAEVAGYSGAGVTARRDDMASDRTFAAKRAFLDTHGLVLMRLSGNWDARRPDPQLTALATALGWADRATTQPGIYTVPKTTVGQLAAAVRGRLDIRSMRSLGAADSPVVKVALSHGFLLVPEVQRLFAAEPAIDVLVAGEPVEWEAFPYLADMVTAGRAKGMILLGHAVSEEPGTAAMGAWLKSIVTEVPVQHLVAGEPFWTAS